MPAIESVEWEDCFLQPRRDPELERRLKAALGFVPPAVPYCADCPWLARAAIHFNWSDGKLVHLDLRIVDQVALVVSRDNSCRYCYAASRLLLRALGMPETRIRRLEEDLLAADFPPHERAAHEFARVFSRASPLPSKDDVRLLREAGWQDPAIRELAVVAGYNVSANRFATLPALPPGELERMPERWFMRVLLPLFGLRMRRRFRPGRPEALAPELRGGPFSFVVEELDGLPLARSVRQVLNDAWQSPLLPQRTKALVFAVVARGLGCPLSEQEATRLLAEDDLGGQEVEAILEHLGSPRLDPLDAEILAFARETIWYQPAPIQRRGRELCRELGPARFLELTGQAAAANMVCRLGATLHALR